jgi:hypothetical protein
MRRASFPRLLALIAVVGCLPLALLCYLSLGAPPALAQAFEVGDGVRVAAGLSRRVNVRSEPMVRAGNVVAGASGGDLLRVVELVDQGTYTWYRVETLENAPIDYQGWIRGDLLSPAQLPEAARVEAPAETERQPPVETERRLPAEVPVGAPTAAPADDDAQPAPLPLGQRTDWSRDLLKLYPAIEGCTSIGSAPPFTVLRATLRGRDLAEVIVSDSAGRRWDCVIKASGGTPMRYDPFSGLGLLHGGLGDEPWCRPGPTQPPLDPECYRLERIQHPESGAQLGWLYYRTCE